MKYAKYIWLVLLGMMFIPEQTWGQEIFEPEGVNIPGQWNGWTNSNDSEVMGNFQMEKRAFAGGQYVTTLNIAASGGDATGGSYNWLFTSGPNDNLYQNKWANANPINVDGISSVVHQGGTDNSITVENGFYYTLILDDNGYNDTQASVFKTSAAPVSITSVSGVPTSEVTENQPVTISVNLDKAKSPEEKIYLRYSTDDFATSSAIEITDFGGGKTGTAEIPGQPKNATIDFYVLSTTIDAANWNGNADLATISFENNSGENYTYFYESSVSPLNNAEDVSRTPEIGWYEVDNQAGYDFQLDNDSDFSSPVVDETGIAQTSYTVTSELNSYTRYYWRFKADTASSWSQSFSFRTESEITFANVQFPESHVMDEGGNVTVFGQLFVPGITEKEQESSAIEAWIGVNETEENPANWAELSWLEADFNAFSTTAGDNDEYELSIGSTLEPGTYYYAYRYQYKTQDFVYGVIDGFWADTNQTLGTLVVKDIPELSAPANATTDVELEPQLSWTTTDDSINEFNLQISESSGFETTVVDEQNLASTSSTYDVDSGALNYETTYYWRVRSEYDTTASGWSPVFSFTTVPSTPDAIALLSPENEATGTSRAPDFEWEESAQAETYQLEVSTDQSFADAGQQVISEQSLTSTTFTVQQANILDKNTQYYWRVKGVNSTGEGPWSDVYSFTTVGDPPTKISGLIPTDGAQSIDRLPTFEWDENATADAYQIQVSEAADDFQLDTLALNKADISATNYTVLQVDQLKEAFTYYWRVRGINNAGSGAWSDTLMFTTAASVPELASPEDGAQSTPVNPVLSWLEIQSAQNYDLQIATDEAFTQIVEDSTAHSDSSYVPSGLDYGNTYYWRVRSQVNEVRSEWSAAFSFTVRASAPEFPQLVSPDSGAVNVSLNPELIWEAPVNADTYDIQVATNDAFSEGLVLDTTNYESTRISLSGLENGTDYFWRVRAINTEGTTGQWSDLSVFTTIPLTPGAVTLLSPADSLFDASIPVQFEWEMAERATRYEFQFAEDEAFTFISDTTVSGTELSVEDFSSGTEYYWRVRAGNGGGTSAWSEVRFIDVGVGGFTGPTLISPENEGSGVATDAVLRWAEIKGSDEYEIQISNSKEMENVLIDTSIVDATELAIENLDKGATYFWRVRGTDSNGATSWSAVNSFTTEVEIPGVVETDQPADSSSNAELPVTFSWHPTTGADYYELKLSEQQNFSISTDSSNIADTTLTLNGLTFDTEYYWKVRAVNDAGAGAWSSVSYFKTTVPLPQSPEIVSPEEGEETQFPVRLAWNATNFAEAYHLMISENGEFESTVIDTSGVEGLIFETNNLDEGTTYFWRIRGVNRSGEGAWSGTQSFTTETLTSLEEDFIPQEFALHQNYPNPFNPTTNIQYDMKEAGEVRIQVFDISGRLIQTLVNERKTAGRYRAKFDASSLASGIYLMRMEAGSFLKVKKMTLIK